MFQPFNSHLLTDAIDAALPRIKKAMEREMSKAVRKAPTTGANARQVGGSHYKKEYEHWDWVEDIGLGYVEGCATKYVTRWRSKDGRKDLEKALHYTDKTIELARDSNRENRVRTTFKAWRDDMPLPVVKATDKFIAANAIGEAAACYVRMMVSWRKVPDLQAARLVIVSILEGFNASPDAQCLVNERDRRG